MSDVVVTVPKWFGWEKWIGEGDAAGNQPTGQTYYFSVQALPRITPGERVYIVHNGKLRGYAPLIEVRFDYNTGKYHLIRGGGAVPVTIHQSIKGFQGFRYRWWERDCEVPFPEWKTP